MAIADDSPAQAPKPSSPEEFVKVYGPIADQVSKEIGVDPRVIIGKWGMETGWGTGIIGEHNLGNVKDPSGKGKRAVDKKEGSNDPYLSFEDPQGWGRYYSDFIKRGYPNAVGAGSDIPKFTTALASGVNGSYFGKTKPEEYQKALTGGYDTASKFYNQTDEQQSQDGDNPFPEPAPLPSGMDKKLEDKRPAFQDMPDWYKNLSPKVRNSEGNISGAQVGAAGALVGAGASFLGNKGLAEMENKVKDARAVYKNAVIAANGAIDSSSATADKLAKEAQRLEQEYKASLAGYQALEQELASATAESKRFAPPEVDTRAKVSTASGAENYARKMPGQLPPEALLAQVEDMTTGKNPRGMGAGDIAARNAANIETQKRLGMGNYQMTGTGSEQFVLGPKETARRQAQMDAAGQKAKQLTPQVQAAQGEVDAAKQARETAEKIRQKSIVATQKAESEARMAHDIAKESYKTAVKEAPQGVGKIGAIWQKIPGANILAGAGMGMSAAEALNRYEKGDTSGAVLSTVQVLLDGMAMLPPGTPITAALKGIGVVGGLATTAYDLYRTHNMEQQKPPQKAHGGLTLMR